MGRVKKHTKIVDQIEIRIIKKLSTIWDGNSLRFKNFSNMDLSDIDLSCIPTSVWENCIFYNTNFTNTNIKFYPNKLRGGLYKTIDMKYCNFTGCDLSYLTADNFKNVEKDYCNFTNTGMYIDWNADISDKNKHPKESIYGVVFDSIYTSLPSSYWNQLSFDLKTLDLNPHIHISSSKLARLYRHQCSYISQIHNECLQSIKYYEKYLEYDKDGDLKRLYEIVKSYGSILNRYNFFSGVIENINFSDLNLSNIKVDVLEAFQYEDCIFVNTKVNVDLEFLTSNSRPYSHNYYFPTKIYIENMPKIDFDSWQHIKSTRIFNSKYTFRINCYVELNRICNAKCKFCRNHSFAKCKYNLDNIKNSLLQLYPYLDDIVIGGGEPTLLLDDLKELRKSINNNSRFKNPNWYIFTNGSITPSHSIIFIGSNIDGLRGLMDKGIRANISRHAIDDMENADIFGIDANKLINTEDLSRLGKYRGSTLCATCFKGGLDNFEKIVKYLFFAKDLSFDRVLLSDLHKDNSSGKDNQYMEPMFINEDLFNKLDFYLTKKGYIKNLPIFSTGGYMTIAYKSDLSSNNPQDIVIKKYISKRELENSWDGAIKRTFDLSIAPDGSIYDSWHQQSMPVKILTMKQK